jgi:hypothetical protein
MSRNARRLFQILPTLLLILPVGLADGNKLTLVDVSKAGVAISWANFARSGAVVDISNSDTQTSCEVLAVEVSRLVPGPGSSGTGSVSATASPAKSCVPANGIAELVIAPSGVKPRPGTYVGTISFFAGKDRITLPPVMIVVTVPTPELLISKAAFTKWRIVPGGWLSAEEPYPLPIRYEDDSAGPGARIVGAVRSDSGGWAQVKWKPRNNGNAGLIVDNPPKAGTYSGDLILFDPAKPLNLTVNTKDIVLWPLLVICLGIALAFWARHYTGVLRITLGLRVREAQIGPNFRDAKQLFDRVAGGKAFATYSIDADLKKERQEVLGNLSTVERSLGTSLDDQNPAYRAATDGLNAIEGVVALWPTFANALDALQFAADAAKAVASPSPALSQLLKQAAVLLSGTAIPVAQVSALNGQAVTLTSNLQQATTGPAVGITANAFAARAEAHFEDNDPRRVRILQQKLGLFDALVAGLAVVIAALTGLNNLYLGNKSFGAVSDYAALFLWAAGTKATLDIVTMVIDKLVPVVTKK